MIWQDVPKQLDSIPITQAGGRMGQSYMIQVRGGVIRGMESRPIAFHADEMIYVHLDLDRRPVVGDCRCRAHSNSRRTFISAWYVHWNVFLGPAGTRAGSRLSSQNSHGTKHTSGPIH